MFKSQTVAPRAHIVENFGSEVQAVTFKYGSEVYTINRRGKRNILGFQSDVEKTYSLTNGKDKFLRMSLYGITFVSWTDTKGWTHDSFTRI